VVCKLSPLGRAVVAPRRAAETHVPRKLSLVKG
jgi:hypothetical protein